MTKQRTASLGDSGFTLVELIVALALLSLTFAALAAVTGFATRATDRARSNERQAELFLAHRFLQETIARAEALYVRSNATGQPILQFDGHADSMTFVANLPGRTTVGGTHIVRLGIVKRSESGNSGALTMSVRVFNALAGRGRERSIVQHELFGPASGLKLAYFGSKTRGEIPRWYPTWTNVPRLPQLISVNLMFPANSKLVWPRTRIALVHQRSSARR